MIRSLELTGTDHACWTNPTGASAIGDLEMSNDDFAKHAFDGGESTSNAEFVSDYSSNTVDGEEFFQIADSHQMGEFFISLIGASDHWMFVSSYGALTAGRRNANNSLFPYLSDDKISATRRETGPLTIVRVASDDRRRVDLWEPFAVDSQRPFAFRRNLYKSPLGHKLVFEEINESLGLSFRYQWTFSEKYGFVRTCRLTNFGATDRSLDLLDGLVNVLPYGVSSDFVLRFSNLANAYKKNELLSGSGIGIYYLSSIPTDRAEPSEGLKSTTVWQTGLDPQATLLSTDQLGVFRSGEPIVGETDVRGRAGAYLVHQPLKLAPGQSVEWKIVADVEQDHSDVVGLDVWLNGSTESSKQESSDTPREDAIRQDIAQCEQELLRIASSADGLQCGGNLRRSNRHLANVIFNVMRGGVPLAGYLVPAADFRKHVATFNRPVAERNHTLLAELPESVSVMQLNSVVSSSGDSDLIRLTLEYLPLAFGRRHGDPTRPWNQFSIELRTETGRTNLNYQGNWRDIFQNWEALAVSFPEFLPAMMCRFVNATTADGYNPYRLTKDGFDWEAPEPNDPWSNIGYWGDHQIIYLLRLMEWSNKFAPQRLTGLLNQRLFVHANVPYRIDDFEAIRDDPRATIEYDETTANEVLRRVQSIGSDGKLLTNQAGEIHYVTLLEKLLTLSLAKLSNFIPDGGIWLNTQRPEWNDANNALVGNGLSMVTACYMHRWFRFLIDLIEKTDEEHFVVSTEVASFFDRISEIFSQHADVLSRETSPSERSTIAAELSQSGSDYRKQLYQQNPSGEQTRISRQSCLVLFNAVRQSLASTIRSNKRADGLYHSYNLLDWTNGELRIDHLDEMLEGQVAVLSARLLSAEEAVVVLDSLSSSNLYREDQSSYMLYPNRELPRFLQKNRLDETFVTSSKLVNELLSHQDTKIVRRDVRGDVHFDGQYRNAADLRKALQSLPSEYRSLIDSEGELLVRHFDDIFRHRSFTGRSMTFFGYEGLGSIYWHMVSKLRLAVVEVYKDAVDFRTDADRTDAAHVEALHRHLKAICRGIGAEKSPQEYGGFPTDPYSHTPENAGVKQPGMTGQVKEDVIARLLELGVHVENGCLHFHMDLFEADERLSHAQSLQTFDVSGGQAVTEIPQHGFGYTLCQVPIIYQAGDSDSIIVTFVDGNTASFDGVTVSQEISRELFARSGVVERIECYSTKLLARVSEVRNA